MELSSFWVFQKIWLFQHSTLEHIQSIPTEISVSTDISLLGFYGYIRYIGGYFYMNIDISEINKNTLKFMEILFKSVKMSLIIKYIVKPRKIQIL